MKKVLKRGLYVFLGLILLGGIGATALVIKGYSELPDLGKLIEGYTPVVPTKIYDTNGKVIDILYKQIRETTTAEEAPRIMKDAFIAIEDRHFYDHHGFYIYGLFRAATVNLIKMRKAQGASSITQQLAKNAFLSNEKKIMRKIKEAIITIQLERNYTKEEILEKYMNEIYFGSGIYGVKTAVRAFYGKNIKDLTIAEAALLAGVPNRPGRYSPRKHLENAVKRAHLVIEQMRNANFITEEEYEKAMEHKFYLEGKLPKELEKKTPEELRLAGVTVIKLKDKERAYRTPDFTNIIEDKLSKLFTEKEIYEEGLQVYTTLDVVMQKAAKDSFNEYEKIHGKGKETLDGGLVTIEADTGYVRAVVGGKDYRSGDYNRAIYAKRQPGSSFKPFVYFTALRLGYPMNTVIEDSKFKVGEWEPRNYTKKFRKNFTLLEGMERSVNVVAIKTLKMVGLSELNKTVKLAEGDMNLKVPQNLTAALGTMVVSPYELTRLYLPFANGGYEVKPQFIKLIKNRYGKVVYRGEMEQKKVFESDDVALITHMLKDVVDLGSGIRAKVYKDGAQIEQGGKTGTTNEQRTAWFAGITPKYVTTVYLGYDDNRPMSHDNSGGGLTAGLWGSYYQKMVDEGIDTGNEFRQIKDGIKNGSLTTTWIDSRNGRVADSSSGYNKRLALFKKGTAPVEKASVYNTGFRNLFEESKDISIDDLDKKNGVENKEGKTEELFNNLFKN